MRAVAGPVGGASASRSLCSRTPRGRRRSRRGGEDPGPPTHPERGWLRGRHPRRRRDRRRDRGRQRLRRRAWRAGTVRGGPRHDGGELVPAPISSTRHRRCRARLPVQARAPRWRACAPARRLTCAAAGSWRASPPPASLGWSRQPSRPSRAMSRYASCQGPGLAVARPAASWTLTVFGSAASTVTPAAIRDGVRQSAPTRLGA
jgi:hypothetical protein